MDKNEIYDLMERFDKSNLAQLDLEMQGVKVSMKKGAVLVSDVPHIQTANVVGNVSSLDSMSKEQENNVVKNKSIGSIDEKYIKAPLVGTFYRAPSPTDKPYIEVGSKVKKGDVIGIIEAMKLMNEITAGEDGEVIAIEVPNGELVEYDQVLVRMK